MAATTAATLAATTVNITAAVPELTLSDLIAMLILTKEASEQVCGGKGTVWGTLPSVDCGPKESTNAMIYTVNR